MTVVQDLEQEIVAVPEVLALLPMRETVIFPTTFAPVMVAQERSLRLVREAMTGSHLVALVTQRDAEARPMHPEDLYTMGTMATIHELAFLEDDEKSTRIAVHGLERIRVIDMVQTEPYLVARVEKAPEREERSTIVLDAVMRTARSLFVRLVGLVAELPSELAAAVERLEDPRQMAYLIGSSVPMSTVARQALLEQNPVSTKLRGLIEVLQHEIAVRTMVQKISTDTAEEISKNQRQQILRKHMEAIQKELGESDPEQAELVTLRERIDRTPFPEEARGEAERELDRLTHTPSISPEHAIIRSYLDWLLKLPWGISTGGPIDVARARAVLDEDHYDLDRVKDRILEYLAVKKLRAQRRAAEAEDTGRREPILCFLGPPGVGKTSLGQSIARAMGRRFLRISLGGIHDEAEIRGHRRTYVGAMPGRILSAISRANAIDPVFMLDEVDKLGVGLQGDPAAALLEVLDPAQNHTFVDSYLGVPFDLSHVLFVCTANTTDTIPPPLLDRMEVLSLSGYTDTEKLHIAERYLVPKELEANGLSPGEATLDEHGIWRVIREYTREAGVRNLDRELATIFRKVARRISEGAKTPIPVTAREIQDYLGPQRVFHDVAERVDRPGVATGLAWTPVGGDILFVEATMMPGDEDRLILTGMLGNVMRESAEAALSYLRSNAERFGIDPAVFSRKIVHVHVPAGAIPKDGPSAGLTILAALASHASGKPVPTTWR